MLFLLRDQDLFSHQSLVLTKGYLSVVGAHRATAAPGTLWVAILWGWKQVMPLLLRPRLHEIHHRAVPGRKRRWKTQGVGGSHSAINMLITLLNDNERRAEGHLPARMDGKILAHVSHQL